MPFSLFDDLKRSGFHSSITTTYSVDPAFYDANIQHRLRAFGCQNNLLMADAAMLSQALEQLPEAFSHAGRKYLVEPIEGAGCFHPKILLRYGKSKAALLLGSANATSAGWGSNRELLSTFEWSQSAEGPDEAVYLRLIAKAHSWLMAQLSERTSPDLTYKLDLLSSQSPWLSDTDHSQTVEELADGSLVDLLLSAQGSGTGIGHSFLSQIEGEVERLIIISPYWDSDLKALIALHSATGGPKVHILLTLSDAPEARQSTFPVSALPAGLKPKFHPLGEETRSRFLHAKMILAQTRTSEHLLYGSANCTVGALGLGTRAGVNHEASIYRRLPRGTVEAALKLTLAGKISLKSIAAPTKSEPSAAPPQFAPGRIERKGQRLYWTVPPGIDPAGAELIIEDCRHPLIIAAGVRPFARMGSQQGGSTIVARVALSDGRVSRSVIVVEPEMLMIAAPNPLGSSIKRRLDAILNGESDLIDLARDIHLIFGDGEQPGRSRAHGTTKGSSTSTVAGEDFDTPEEFREALGLKADLMAASLVHADNAAIQQILQIVLRGIVQLENNRTIDEDSAASLLALRAGEDQDDEGDEGEDGNYPPPVPERPKQSQSEPKPILRMAFERNRSMLERAIDRFEAYTAKLARSKSSLELDYVTHATIIIYLMLHGCSQRYTIEDGEAEVLIPFSAIGTKQQDKGFLLRAARLTKMIWGSRFVDGLLARIALDRELTSIPTPLLTLAILSRWILAAILSEARTAIGTKSLASILETQIPQIYRSTSAFAPTIQSQVDAAITQMASQIGMSEAKAHNVRQTMVELGTERHMSLNG